MIDRELQQQFETISKTRFWKEYVDRVIGLRTAHEKLLQNGDISEPTTKGKYWQDVLKYANQILAIPDKLIGTGDNE